MPSLAFTTALGTCRLAWNERGLTGFRLPDDATAPVEADDAAALASAPEWVRDLVERARRHLAGAPQEFSAVPLDWTLVSEFQRGVYEQTLAIKPGRTTSYGAIARALQLGADAARAVGVALGSNPWPLVVPCHRVIAANGRMTGFSAPGGVRTKTRLLALEGAELPLA